MELLHPWRLDFQQPAPLRSTPVVSLVLPCFNEQEVLPETTRRLVALLARLEAEGVAAPGSAIYYVDDGSSDATWRLVADYAATLPAVCGIKLSRNRGHQNALLCGLMTAPGDVLVSLDADLQDDVEAIPKMLAAWRDGNEIVYAVRSRRDADGFLKRVTAEGYYRLLACLGVQVLFNHADFRLMSRRAIESLRAYEETHLFLRGLVPQLGYRTAVVEFARAARFAGTSKYPLRKMLALAWQGITSFTAYPLRLITGVGALVSLASLLMSAWALGIRLFTDHAMPGWASVVIPMYLLGGIQLLSLGVIGEYLAKVYESTKKRPRFHVEAVVGQAFGAEGA
ncbi:glycosyltransferase involved in cell wall biosynthesis [Pseudoduganella lurida]|uniref:Glycosyltransferase involved in cell wall biosynthesis n=1 Tax=Pseudoduganella lurida TaxID=1036180 RepID=A0A562R1Z9_9BURK|nr:glycosyltransferase family 2 protein [Pseudoduganella lurida]TWI63078.1 glycosyltransferase involved in cell wall biosynthesis [Pseudoduganella lurida]